VQGEVKYLSKEDKMSRTIERALEIWGEKYPTSKAKLDPRKVFADAAAAYQPKDYNSELSEFCSTLGKRNKNKTKVPKDAPKEITVSKPTIKVTIGPLVRKGLKLRVKYPSGKKIEKIWESSIKRRSHNAAIGDFLISDTLSRLRKKAAVAIVILKTQK